MERFPSLWDMAEAKTQSPFLSEHTAGLYFPAPNDSLCFHINDQVFLPRQINRWKSIVVILSWFPLPSKQKKKSAGGSSLSLSFWPHNPTFIPLLVHMSIWQISVEFPQWARHCVRFHRILLNPLWAQNLHTGEWCLPHPGGSPSPLHPLLLHPSLDQGLGICIHTPLLSTRHPSHCVKVLHEGRRGQGALCPLSLLISRALQ